MKKIELQRQEDLKNAKYLAKRMEEYTDDHSKELKGIFLSFIKNPKQDIREMIHNTKTEPELPYCRIYDFSINDFIFEINYPHYLVPELPDNDLLNTNNKIKHNN